MFVLMVIEMMPATMMGVDDYDGDGGDDDDDDDDVDTVDVR